MPNVHHQPAPLTIWLLRVAASPNPRPWSAISGRTYSQMTVIQTETTNETTPPMSGRMLRRLSPREMPNSTTAYRA